MNESMEQIGEIGVDSGSVWIGDPCYVMGDDATARVRNWDDFVNRTYDESTQLGDSGASEPAGRLLGI